MDTHAPRFGRRLYLYFRDEWRNWADENGQPLDYQIFFSAYLVATQRLGIGAMQATSSALMAEGAERVNTARTLYSITYTLGGPGELEKVKQINWALGPWSPAEAAEAFDAWRVIGFGCPGGPDIFTERGIPAWVRHSRPYVYWTTKNRAAVEAEFKDLHRAGRGFLRGVTKQRDGYLILRDPPGEPDLPSVYAELRPDKPVKTGKKIKHSHTKDFKGKPEFLARHLEAEHGGVDVAGEHTHDRWAKYLFPPAPKIDKEWWHDHDEYYAGKPRIRAKHEAKAVKDGGHDGEVVSGCHLHTSRIKDRTVNYAKRIDVHPLAESLFANAPRVFFVIEGELKADAILGQGEAVFSIPSVTLAEPQELELVVRELVPPETPMFIVCDADWSRNPAVVAHALLNRQIARRVGVKEVHVAAPPADEDESGELRYKGNDDFIGAGGTVDELVVIRRELPEVAFNRQVREMGRPGDGRLRNITGLRNEVNALQNLILLAADGKDPRFPRGTIHKNLSQLAKLMGTKSHKNAERGIKKLQEDGLITIDGSTETEAGRWKGDYYDWELDWINRPVITICRELQAVELDPTTVGELTGHIEQFPTRSPDEIESLIREGRQEAVA
jgi:hypothetical protein